MILEREEGTEREREREGQGEKHWCFPPIDAPTRDQTCNLGMCPDLGSNLQSFGVWTCSRQLSHLARAALLLLKSVPLLILLMNIQAEEGMRVASSFEFI